MNKLKILINYADSNFSKQQQLNSKTGLKKGSFDKVIEFSPSNIGEEFKKKHDVFLKNNPRGAGYWLWKPYIILKALEEAEDGDYIFYCDAGAIFVNSIEYLIEAMENEQQSVFLTQNPLLEKQWTKVECFQELGCVGKEYSETGQAVGGYILVKKDAAAINFINDYYELCCKYYLLDDSKTDQQIDEFIDHRHDQSLLSLLAKKRKYSFFRDISQYGIRPFQYIAPGREYSIQTYKNSTYPQILLSYRKDNWIKVYIKEKIKDYLGFKLRF